LLVFTCAYGIAADLIGSSAWISVAEHRGLSIMSCSCLFLFAVLLAFVCLGPVRFLFNTVQTEHAVEPAMLAGKISLAIHVMLLASPVLFASAVLMLVAVLVPAKVRS
jgi:hypothetical protein